MKTDLYQIMTILREIIPTIQKRYYVDEIKVFDSFLRNEQNRKSDLDLLVTFSKTPTLLKFIELENYLSDKLGMKVDLVMKKAIKPRLKSYILQNAISV